jgi:hypothetical protein
MAQSPDGKARRWTLLVLPAFLFAASTAWFARELRDEPFFRDEGATLAHTYYYRLLKEGRFHAADWLHQASYDHLQFCRILVGLSLDAAGYDLPKTIAGMEEWWRGGGWTPASAHPGDRDRLHAARWPMLLGAAFGCSMIFVVGRMLVGPTTGLLAALFLAASPLYATHARRALVDDWVQALVLAAFAGCIASAKRAVGEGRSAASSLWAASAAGLFLGLAVGAKLNALVAPAAVVLLAAATLVWALASRLRRGPSAASLGVYFAGVLVSLTAATVVFFAMHPYFYANPDLPPPAPGDGPEVVVDGAPRSREWLEKSVRPLADASPWGRLTHMLRYRQEQMNATLRENRFPDAALESAPARAWAILDQGLGRWSAAGGIGLPASLAWIPASLFVLLGWVWCLGEGRRQWAGGEIPAAWLIAAWAPVEVAVLLRELTLDWDRYYMGVVAWSSLLAAIGVGGTSKNLMRRMILAPPSDAESEPERGNAASSHAHA